MTQKKMKENTLSEQQQQNNLFFHLKKDIYQLVHGMKNNILKLLIVTILWSGNAHSFIFVRGSITYRQPPKKLA